MSVASPLSFLPRSDDASTAPFSSERSLYLRALPTFFNDHFTLLFVTWVFFLVSVYNPYLSSNFQS
ncbi:uncharacterized protein BT62DRAFT_931560 [Guyanagaster necrorhizus]|uniref:Uncharacterized protein n=1 Tax=Guyanagaster necrorhizus TaxID=856835 RepID=A0A9P7VUU4_9AGAR|nr:uncharacterized protein BT62DRAFT_931560 [Guyanagaster necrorhizus MCA 3950]KAG7446982.1 hypothetical protein BT62DRAFT_931560 [Guyanagaster necrorhizus MCA 3950]